MSRSDRSKSRGVRSESSVSEKKVPRDGRQGFSKSRSPD